MARPVSVWSAGRYLLRSMRPKQWTKNSVIFVALFFTVNLYWSPANFVQLGRMLASVVVAFVLFCFLSSGVYLVNDLVDIEKDRQHPFKRLRPLPAGLLSPALARTAAALLLGGSLALAFALGWPFGLTALAYAGLNLAYSFFLKHIVLVDVFSIAAGFVLRAMAGAVVIDVPISPWLYLCTILGSLFLGFAKRRHELVLLGEDANKHRQILKEYSPQLLDQAIAVVTSSIVMAYSLYTFTAANLPRNGAMMFTIPFVLYGIFRYLYLTHLRNEGGSPEEILLKDKPLIACIVLWLATSLAVLVVFRQH